MERVRANVEQRWGKRAELSSTEVTLDFRAKSGEEFGASCLCARCSHSQDISSSVQPARSVHGTLAGFLRELGYSDIARFIQFLLSCGSVDINAHIAYA